MNQNIINELFASHKKLTINFNTYKKEQTIILEKLNNTLTNLEKKIDMIEHKHNNEYNIHLHELKSIKKNIENNFNV